MTSREPHSTSEHPTRALARELHRSVHAHEGYLGAVVSRALKVMDPNAAGKALERALSGERSPITVTVADASVKSGLPLRDAEAGLTWLTSEYRAHLRVTDDGDL